LNDQDHLAYGDLWRDLRVALVRRWLTVVIVFIASLLAGYAALDFVTERYEAQGRLLVKLGRENAEVPLTVEKGSVYSSGVQKEEINSYIRLFSSRVLVEETVDQIGLERFEFRSPPPATVFQSIKHGVKGAAKWTRRQLNEVLIALDLRKRLTPREETIRMVQKGLDVVRERDSNVILTLMQLPDPQLAKQVIEVMTDNYLRRHIALRQNADAWTVLDEQTEAYQKEIESLQANASQIKRKWNLSSVDEQRAQLLSRLHALKKNADETHTLIERLMHEQQQRRELLEQLPRQSQAAESIEPNPLVESIKSRLADLQLERVRKVGRYFEDSEVVQTIDREMQSLHELLSAEETTQVGEVQYRPHPLTEDFLEQIEQTRVQLAGLEPALELQEAQVAALEKELQDLNDGEDELRMVDLQRQVTEQKYFTYATRREEARIAQLFDAHRVANIAVLSEPTVGTLPVYPRKMLIMAVTAATGLLLGTFVATLLARRHPIIHGGEDMAEFQDIPVLGVLRRHAEPTR